MSYIANKPAYVNRSNFALYDFIKRNRTTGSVCARVYMRTWKRICRVVDERVCWATGGLGDTLKTLGISSSRARSFYTTRDNHTENVYEYIYVCRVTVVVGATFTANFVIHDRRHRTAADDDDDDEFTGNDDVLIA